MKSPFAVFRDNQKVLMVVLVGLSMIGFVFLGAIPNPENIPNTLIFITIIAVAGGAAWVIGMPQKRSAEYGIWGVVLGVAAAIFITRTGGPAPAMLAKDGNVSMTELVGLRQQRQIAHEFVARALQATQPLDALDMRAQTELMQKQRQFMLGFGLPDDRDVLTTELLYREAEAMGLEANEATVTEYLTQLSDGKLSQEKLKEICGELKISASQIYEILERELQARMAAELLYDYAFDEIYRISPTLPPEQYWDFYRKLYVRQKVAAAAVPVDAFVNPNAEPSESQLQELFAAHAANFPHRDAEGQPAPGDPGFRQPRRVRIAYLESAFDDVKETIEPVTEEEISERYQQDYVRPAEEAAERERERAEQEAAMDDAADGPALPGAETSTDEEASTEPDDTADPPSQPDDPPADESPAPNSETDAPASESPPTDEQPEASTTNPPAEESSAEPTPESNSEADGTADAAPSDSADTAETNVDQTEPEPADDNDTTQPDSADDETDDGPAEANPAVPLSNIPLLDTVLREEIRIKIENERTREKMQEQMGKVAQWFESQVGELMFAPEGSDDRITDQQAAELVRDYAQQHNLHYAETEFLSFTELTESEEHPVGKSMTVVPLGARPQTLPNAIFETRPEDRYRPITTEEVVNSSWFVVWKVEDKADYIPESMNDERIREQVVQAWRVQQARPQAKDRAEELAELVRATDAPMAEALSEMTVTGDEDSLFVQVTETGEFTWLTTGSTQPQLYSRTPPVTMSPAGIEKGGEDFMRVVFDELAEGDVGVAVNADRSIYYVVTVKDRIPAAGEDFETFRNNFLAQQVFEKNDLFAGMGFDSVYRQLAVMKTQESQSDFWVDDLWNRHAAEQLTGGG